MMTGGRWLTTAGAAWLGVALQLQQAALWPRGLYLMVLIVALLLLVGTGWWHRAQVAAPKSGRPWRADLGAAGTLGLALALGWGWAGWRAEMQLRPLLSPGLMQRDVQLTGTVAEMPRRHADGVSFVFEVEEARVLGQVVSVPRTVSLGWYRGWHDGELRSGPQVDPQAGQRWRFTTRLAPPLGLMNPHGFDLELWLFAQGIRAVGPVRAKGGSGAELLEATARHPVERARGAVRAAIDARVPDARAAGVLAGLAVGDQQAIEAQDWALYRKTGVAHLMAISGLHITMFAWLASRAVRWAWRRSRRAVRWCDAGTAGRWGGLALAGAYAVFAGWGVPAQRTVLMLAVVTLLRSRARLWPWPMTWASAALAVTVMDPWAVLQPGFWLSFAAVGLLMLEGKRPEGEHDPVADAPASRGDVVRHSAWGMLRTQWRATLGLAPLSLIFFHQISVVGFVANLVAIPWVTLVCTPLALAGVVVPALWDLGAWSVQVLNAVLTPLAAWPSAVWSVAAAPAWAQAAALLGGVLLLSPLPRPTRAWGLPLCLPLLMPPLASVPPGRFEVLAADIGQGTAVLVRTAQHSLLFDAGPQFARDSDAGARVLVPLLTALGVARLDRLVLSHSDLDHVGGATSLGQGVPVDSLLSSLPEEHALRALAPQSHTCEAGQRWNWDGVDFEVLHPTQRDLQRAAAGYLRPNGVSCVLRVGNREHQVLLTGDIEAEEEWALVQRLGNELRSEVLVVPHHGSRSSSTQRFLQAVAPRMALMQLGWRNRYGHPAPEVMARYAALGIPVVASPACGAWRWLEGEGVCIRAQAQRYWHTRLGGGVPGGLELANPQEPQGALAPDAPPAPPDD